MAETRAEFVQALVFVMIFLSGESRTSGEREAIARCCPEHALTVIADHDTIIRTATVT